jgi:demethylmenaquinone methyltransferase/2-methoxy-6-polyprenyl-1,4-benzoquinol methylase
VTAVNEQAKELFAPLGPTYDRYGSLLSFGQDPRWRRFLVSRIDAGPHDTVLDVATGTAAVALAAAAKQVRLVEGSADELPFEDGQFDALTFTYLLRYVDDPLATLRGLARVVRHGGSIAMLEFGLPRGLWRPLWELYVRVGLPGAGRLISPGWQEVGRFLGPSIRGFHARHPSLPALFREAGIAGVQERRLSLGGGVVVWGRKA